MLVGITFGGILAGSVSLVLALCLGLGLVVAGLGYVAGGVCGSVLMAALAAAASEPAERRA